MEALPITEMRIKRLQEIGLSNSAARVYLALLDLGATQAREVSTLSRVPTSKIYRILDQLHEKGLVAVAPETPKQYAPLPLDAYVSLMQRAYEDTALALARDMGELAGLFAVSGGLDLGQRGGITVLRGRPSVAAQIDELATGSTVSLLTVASHGMVARRTFLTDAWARAQARGVRIRVVLPPAPDRQAPLQAGAPGGVIPGDARHCAASVPLRRSDMGIIVVDGAVALLAHFVPDDARSHTGKDTGLVLHHAALVELIEGFAEASWDGSGPQL